MIALSHLLTDTVDVEHNVALRNNTTIPFAQFRHDVSVAAAQFHSIRNGALICQDSYNFCVGFFGLLHAGARIILPPNNQPSSIAAFNVAFDALIDDHMIETLSSAPQILAPLDPATHAIDVFTSGSTGMPQKIVKNLDGFQREIEVLEKLWGHTLSTGPVYATVSHQHIYGLTFKLLWPLVTGRAFAAETHMLWEDLLTGMASNATLISSPAHLSRMQGIKPLPPDRRMKAVFSAGAPLTIEAAYEANAALGIAPVEIFGSTETAAIATRSSITNDPWQTVPGVQIRIDDQKLLSINTPFAGDGWIETKDFVEAAHGGFRFLGRADTIVKIEGKRVSLTAVEQALIKLPEIEQAAAVLVAGTPERLVAAVVLSQDGKAALERLGQFRLGRCLRNAMMAQEEASSIPRLWRFVEALPAQAMGKRRVADILALFQVAL